MKWVETASNYKKDTCAKCCKSADGSPVGTCYRDTDGSRITRSNQCRDGYWVEDTPVMSAELIEDIRRAFEWAKGCYETESPLRDLLCETLAKLPPKPVKPLTVPDIKDGEEFRFACANDIFKKRDAEHITCIQGNIFGWSTDMPVIRVKATYEDVE